MKKTLKPQGKCPECGKNLYEETHETDPVSPEDPGFTFKTLECESCEYWRHKEPDDSYIED